MAESIKGEIDNQADKTHAEVPKQIILEIQNKFSKIKNNVSPKIVNFNLNEVNGKPEKCLKVHNVTFKKMINFLGFQILKK